MSKKRSLITICALVTSLSVMIFAFADQGIKNTNLKEENRILLSIVRCDRYASKKIDYLIIKKYVRAHIKKQVKRKRRYLNGM